MSEKILARASGLAAVRPGDIVDASVDVAMAHEACAQVVRPFNEIGAERIWAPEKVVIPIDHWVPASDEKSAILHATVRAFVRKHNLQYFYEIGNHGISHQILVEQGHVLPWDLVTGTDSHTNMAGALGAFAAGVGPTEMAAIFATGTIWLRVPETMRFIVRGKLKFPVSSKDLVLKIIGTIGDDGARYRAVEFEGGAIEAMDVWERLTLTNMTTEMGAKTGIIAPDAKTRRYLEAEDIKNGRRGELAGRIGLRPDPVAKYHTTLEFDASELVPLVAKPPSPDNVVQVTEVEGTRVDQVFLGSCTNARIEDLRIAASVLKGRQVKEGVRMMVFPASTSVYKMALEEGLIKTFTDAGAVFNASACGACFGAMGGVLGPEEVCASTSNRNYIGRMGHRTSKSYLMSPATAAATAVEGAITDPRKFFPGAAE
jgi:3-isopropylmalate/(R)-2-methylmalate dehydratase large subunit